MTPDPQASAALLVMACPWLGLPSVCVPAASRDYMRVIPPVVSENATQETQR